MSEISDAFLNRALESLAGAESEMELRRYNNCANRSYYACFQAAIAALDVAGIRPRQGRLEWSHTFVQAQFVGQLVNRRKLYPAAIRNALSETQQTRERADYRITPLTQVQALRSLGRARVFVTAVLARTDETQ